MSAVYNSTKGGLDFCPDEIDDDDDSWMKHEEEIMKVVTSGRKKLERIPSLPSVTNVDTKVSVIIDEDNSIEWNVMSNS